MRQKKGISSNLEVKVTLEDPITKEKTELVKTFSWVELSQMPRAELWVIQHFGMLLQDALRKERDAKNPTT